MGLIKCNACGKEVSDQATSCPNCGHPMKVAPPSPGIVPPQKKKGSCLKTVIIIFGVIVVIGVIANLGSSGDKTKKTDTKSANANTQTEAKEKKKKEDAQTEAMKATETESVLKTSPGDLLTSYEANEVKGDEIYKDKRMELSGKIKDIGKDIVDDVYITFEGSEEFSITSVQCYFSDEAEIKKVMELQKGQEITLVGDCSGKFGNVLIKDCILK